MSYGRGDLSGGFNDPPSYSSYQNSQGSTQADYTRLTNLIGSNIQKITRNVQDIKRMVNQLGTSHDTRELLERLQQQQHYSNQLAKDTSKYLKDVKNMSLAVSGPEQRHRKTQTDRLVSDFSDALNTLQATQREAAIAEKECVARVRAASASQHDQSTDVLVNIQGTMQEQQQSQITADELAEIQERENAIKQLEADILDVNMIFKDLGQMVHEQGDIIDSIEANVEHAEENVQQGNKQLVQARASQSSARKKKFICAVVVLVIIAIIITIIVVTTKKN